MRRHSAIRPEIGEPSRRKFVTKPSIARVYSYLLGGKDHYSFDREIADRLLEFAPHAPEVARANRDFVKRVVRHLTRAHGVRQFLDIGTGLPDEENVHQIAREVIPDARVVYVDNDPVVLSHARALLAVDDRITVVDGDLRDPAGFLDHEETRRLIDFTEPVAVLMIGVLHFLTAADDPFGAVARVLGAVAPGSHLALSHVVGCPETVRCGEILGTPGFGRTKKEIAGFFDGLDHEQPGLVPASRWRPVSGRAGHGDEWLYAGVGRTPSR